MAQGFNKVILIGNLTADPELGQTTSGLSVCSFSIAVNRRKAQNEQDTKCDFINVVAWRERAEFVSRYFKKGNPILIVGQIQTRSYTDNSGNKRTATEVLAEEVSFVPGVKKEDAEPAKYQTPASVYNPFVPSKDDPKFEEIQNDESLPF